MTAWTKTTSSRFYDMMGILPPEYQTGYGFLVGEPSCHRTCSVTGKFSPKFAAFIKFCGKEPAYFEASEPLTIPEFKAVRRQDVVSA